MGRKLGEFLVAEGRISQGVLSRALLLQGTQARGLSLGAILLRWGVLHETTLLEALSKHHRCPSVDWARLSAAPKESIKLLSAAQSERLGAVAFASDRKTVSVAFANPSNLAAIDEVQAITGKRVVASVTTQVRLLQAQQHFYKRPIGRDIWTVLQKIEAPKRTEHSPADPVTPISAESAAAAGVETQPQPPEPTPSPAASEEPEPEYRPRALRNEEEQAVEDLDDPAPVGLIETMRATTAQDDARERNNSTHPIGKVEDVPSLQTFLEGLPLAELLAERIDPFADDTPLADFIEQALAFYETHPTFQSALNSLDQDSVESLGSSLEDDPLPAPAFTLDSTLPSARRPKRETGEDLAL